MNLSEKIDPAHTTLLVIDVQNEFCSEKGAFSKTGCDIKMFQEMVPRLLYFINQCKNVKLPVIFLRNVYNSEKNWFLSEVWLDQARRKWGGRYVDIPVCEENTFGWEFYKVRPEKDDVVVTKHRFDAFMDTDLDVILRSKGIKTLIVTGLVTNVCVETTARHAFLKDYYVVVPDDCVAAYTLKSHLNSLENIDNYFGEVTSSHEITRIWKRKKLLSS